VRNFFVITLFLCAGELFADCTKYYLLGSQKQNLTQLPSEEMVVFSRTSQGYEVSKPLKSTQSFGCRESGGFVLLSDSSREYFDVPLYNESSYALQKGWNYLTSPKDGLDVIATFSEYEDVEFVYVYDKQTRAWAGYSPHKEFMELILSTRVLGLKSIEPRFGFYILSKKALNVPIKSIELAQVCLEKKESSGYGFITASAYDSAINISTDNSVGFESRYTSHYTRGVYDDTRLMLIYPKLEITVGKKLLKYGPAVPKARVHYVKEYEEKKFYVFDYKTKNCYEGVFPSRKIPPFPTLKKLK
jgi:hypothetical protein